MENEYAIALGTFDGLHKGHISVLRKALSFKDLKKAVITFSLPPKSIIGNTEPELLMTAKEKSEILTKMGFDEVIFLDFNLIRDLSPLEFLSLIFEEFPIKEIAVGYNYRFGKNGSGDTKILSEFCRENGAVLNVLPEEKVDGEAVSSTVIRELVKNGEIKKANRMLSHNFYFKSEVIDGDHRGRELGFPTVNQIIPESLVMPQFGVYASYVSIGGRSYPAVTNIGKRPTFNKSDVIAETNVFDFSGDCYGKTLSVELIDFIRPEKKFNSKEELIKRMETDKAIALKVL